MYPNIFASVLGLGLGQYSLKSIAQSSEKSPVQFANAYITILNGVVNAWQAFLSKNMETFEKWHPFTFTAEALFQVLIMGNILYTTPIDEIEPADLYAVYITIVIGIDAFLDNITDYLYELNEDQESKFAKSVQIVKIVYNSALALLGKNLWDKAYAAWSSENLEEYNSLFKLTNPSEWFKDGQEYSGSYCSMTVEYRWIFFLKFLPYKTLICTEYSGVKF